MSWRRLRVVLQHLPPESHTMTAIRNTLTPEERAEAAEAFDPEQGRWSQVEHLLAGIADNVARLEYITILAHSSGKGPSPKAPEPIPRPGVSRTAERRRGAAPLTEAGADRLFRLIHGGA